MTTRLLGVALSILIAAAAHGATITVNSAGDGTGSDGVCTLREALVAANTNAPWFDCPAGSPGLDTIAFNIGGGGAHTISTASELHVMDPAAIDGSTQPGFAGTPLITILGPGGPPFPINGITIQASAPGSSVRSLAIGGFLVGIFSFAPNTVIAGNYIGLDHTGLNAIPTQVGVWFLADPPGGPHTGNVLGGPAPADRNIIVTSGSTAVAMGFLTPGNVVQNNVLGLNAAGVRVGNTGAGMGLQGTTGTLITGNVMAGMVGGAISIDLDSHGNIVQNNTIGQADAPNSRGIIIAGGSNDNVIGALTSGGPGGNTIAHTVLGEGVEVRSGTGNSILTNSIHHTGIGSGIGLAPFGRNPNDDCDGDTGANELQNRPMLASALVSGGAITIQGSLNSTPSSSFTIELFSNPTFNHEAQTYLGSTLVSTNAGCNGSFTAVLPVTPVLGTWVTATATDSNGNTSEISDPVLVLGELQVTKSFTPPVRRPGEPSLLTITFTNTTGTAITGLMFTDAFPAGLLTATVPNASSTCGGTLTAEANDDVLALTGGTVPAGGTCSVSVMVVANEFGSYTNTLPAGSVTSLNTVPNAAPVTAVLSVHEPVPTLSTYALAGLAIALAFIAVMKRGV